MKDLSDLKGMELLKAYYENLKELDEGLFTIRWRSKSTKEGDWGISRKHLPRNPERDTPIHTVYIVWGINSAQRIEQEVGAYLRVKTRPKASKIGRSSLEVYAGQIDSFVPEPIAEYSVLHIISVLERWQQEVQSDRPRYGVFNGVWVPHWCVVPPRKVKVQRVRKPTAKEKRHALWDQNAAEEREVVRRLLAEQGRDLDAETAKIQEQAEEERARQGEENERAWKEEQQRLYDPFGWY